MDFKNINGHLINLGESRYGEQVESIARRLKEHFKDPFESFGIPKFAIILGTAGPKNFLNLLNLKKVVPYSQIGFPISKASGHSPTEEGPEAKVHYGLLDGVPVLICVGRIHYYECGDMDKVTLMVRSICFRYKGFYNYKCFWGFN